MSKNSDPQQEIAICNGETDFLINAFGRKMKRHFCLKGFEVYSQGGNIPYDSIDENYKSCFNPYRVCFANAFGPQETWSKSLKKFLKNPLNTDIPTAENEAQRCFILASIARAIQTADSRKR